MPNESELAKLEEAFGLSYPLSLIEEAGGDEVGWEAMKKAAAAAALADPYGHGYENPVWKLAEEQLKQLREKFPSGVIYLVIQGGNRSSKSEFAARYVSQSLVRQPRSKWWCADATEAASRDNQQRYIEKYLPVEWRPGESGALEKRHRKVTKVRFSQSGGFTENMLVLPHGSECRFKFYEQKLNTLQAVALDGFWGDELLPYEWIEEIEWRLVERNGLFLVTFTPISGWTQTVGHFVEGASVLEEVEADPHLLPSNPEASSSEDQAPLEYRGEKVHRVLQCVNPRARVIYFHSSDNPVFGNWEGIKAKARGQPRHEILMRVYGMVSKAAYAQFPFFSDGVHVCPDESIPKEGSNYLFVDPCDGRNWFMLWIRITAEGKWYVYREWPSHGHPAAYIPGIGDAGPWAVAGKALDGERGTAQDSFQFGLTQYKQEIERLEDTGQKDSDGKPITEQILERFIDIRFANSSNTEVDGARTLIEQMESLGMIFEGTTAKEIKPSTALVNELLHYDRETGVGEFSASLGRLNYPRLKISSQCPNVIYALKTWTGKDGNKGATKDPIDLLRYAAASGIDYVVEEAFTWRRF